MWRFTRCQAPKAPNLLLVSDLSTEIRATSWMRLPDNRQIRRTWNEEALQRIPIIEAIKQHEARTKVGDIRREFGIYNGTFVKFAKRMPESALVPVTRGSKLGNRAMAKTLQPGQARAAPWIICHQWNRQNVRHRSKVIKISSRPWC